VISSNGESGPVLGIDEEKEEKSERERRETVNKTRVND